MGIIELRNYLLKPGSRDRFIKYFQEHFVHTQEALDISVPQQYRVKNQPDRFFWIRGFNDMQQRSRFLPAFYGGKVWKEFGPAANDMMLEWHNVHLLKPISAEINVFASDQGILVVDYYTAIDNQLDNLIETFTKVYVPVLASENITNLSLWVSEMTENDFPRLPVYQDKDLLVVTTSYKSEQEYESFLSRFITSHKPISHRIKELTKNKAGLILFPA